MANDAANRRNNFRTNPAAPAGRGNADYISRYPGFHHGLIGANDYVRGNVGGILHWEVLPGPGEELDLRHFLQMPRSSASSAHGYLDTIFLVMADEKFPSVTLDTDILQVDGSKALHFYIETEDDQPWDEFRLRALSSKIDPTHAEMARLYKPIIVKHRGQVEWIDELDDRWHPAP